MKEGNGTLTWKDGTRFTGQFQKDKITGEGEMLYPNKRSYRGSFKDGLMHGKGVFEVKNIDEI